MPRPRDALTPPLILALLGFLALAVWLTWLAGFAALALAVVMSVCACTAMGAALDRVSTRISRGSRT